MKSITTKPMLSQPRSVSVHLFDGWFDPIETEVRERAREFIEELIRGELDAGLARPRYWRGPMTGDEESTGNSGYRHGHRTRSLTGTFGPIKVEVPRARLNLTLPLQGQNQLPKVIGGVRFQDGIEVIEASSKPRRLIVPSPKIPHSADPLLSE